MNLELKQLNRDFSVCKLRDLEHVDLNRDFTFIAKTDDELSLVCETQYVPPSPIAAEHGWKALKICGVLDFNLVGIIAKISGILADEGIPVFVISTYNTDYILIKYENYNEAVLLLQENKYQLT
ncbi:MAG: ACT domain-containing protein [Lachnospiraceae bacterium]